MLRFFIGLRLALEPNLFFIGLRLALEPNLRF
jgi:hypothetical protein